MNKIWIPTLFLLSTSAFAGVEQDIQKCATISDKLDRLICYDNLAKGVSPKVSSPEANFGKVSSATETSSSDQFETRGQTTETFGITKPTGKQLERVELTVAKVAKSPHGKLTITFENGQVWKQSETKRFKLKSGQKAYIKRGALGSFILGTPERNSSIRVKRIK
ncbi:hypothetical protein SOPP22_19080 [Shewanella sp. OPT22]|nr:hypothetical protein SOPP22_19080 [Shewanella sp. OPT22]